MANRTKAGSPSEKARDKYGASDGSFPIFDKKSAHAALKLRGRRTGKARLSIIRRAAKYLPEEAKKALEADRKSGKL